MHKETGKKQKSQLEEQERRFLELDSQLGNNLSLQKENIENSLVLKNQELADAYDEIDKLTQQLYI